MREKLYLHFNDRPATAFRAEHCGMVDQFWLTDPINASVNVSPMACMSMSSYMATPQGFAGFRLDRGMCESGTDRAASLGRERFGGRAGWADEQVLADAGRTSREYSRRRLR